MALLRVQALAGNVEEALLLTQQLIREAESAVAARLCVSLCPA